MSGVESTNQDVRVVIIGGGVVGTSVLYWLTKLGCNDVVLLERSELTAGSTWQAAGNVTTLHGAYDVSRIQAYSMALYKSLDEETAGAVGLHRLGCLFLAHHEDQMDEYRMQLGRSRLLGYDYELVSPREACELHPFMQPGGIVGALYDPGYGHVDPSGLTNCSRKLGAGCGSRSVAPRTGDGVVRASRRVVGCQHPQTILSCPKRRQRGGIVGRRGSANGRGAASGHCDRAPVRGDRRDCASEGT